MRKPILQTLVRLTKGERPRVRADTERSSPILAEHVIKGTMRYSKKESLPVPLKEIPRILIAWLIDLNSSMTVGKNRNMTDSGITK